MCIDSVFWVKLPAHGKDVARVDGSYVVAREGQGSRVKEAARWDTGMLLVPYLADFGHSAEVVGDPCGFLFFLLPSHLVFEPLILAERKLPDEITSLVTHYSME